MSLFEDGTGVKLIIIIIITSISESNTGFQHICAKNFEYLALLKH